ncbi:hydantoinase B/oxoprolinase family protein [Salibacterium aidingense]|uniref:hydantoinase B/oxoprolinase family protein n=1 Tax=Salibacterium aidingense TaxID=384933 RepID=UPI003BBBF4C4
MIEAQVAYSKLEAVSREMGERFQRISRSPLIAQDRAFAAAVMTSDMELAAQHQLEAGHLFALKESVAALFDYFSFDIAEGDILLTADPYSGGTQAQTITMAAPLFYEGELILFPVLRAQMADMSGEYPGGFHPDAFEVWQESVRVTPLKLYKQGVKQRDLWNFLLANTRAPSVLEADLEAMHACLQTAQKQLLQLNGQIPAEKMENYLEEIFQYTRQQALRELPSELEPAGQASVSFQAAGEPLAVAVTIQQIEDGLHLDFSGTSIQTNAPFNMTRASAKAYAVWPLIASLKEEPSLNEGLLSAFTFTLPEGSLVSPNLPAATAFSGIITGHFTAEAVMAACHDFEGTRDIDPVHGPGPQAVLFPPIGTEREIEPLFLTPGYPRSPEGMGPPALFGGRRLVSAEELEVHNGFRMTSREWKEEDGGMAVSIQNDGQDVMMNILMPEAANRYYGHVERTMENPFTFTRSAAEERFRTGEEVTFYYPGKGGPADESK